MHFDSMLRIIKHYSGCNSGIDVELRQVKLTQRLMLRSPAGRLTKAAGHNDLTHSTMKRLTSLAASPSASYFGRLLLMVLVVPFGLSSCIYDSYEDEFYRTLWVAENFIGGSSTNDPKGNSSEGLEGISSNGPSRASCSKVTLEFLCGGSVSIQADGAIGSYGTYQADGTRAEFKNLTLTYQTGSATTVFIIEEATRKDDKLQLNWHNTKSRAAQFTTMRRLSAYE